jgi:hypothetical protein
MVLIIIFLISFLPFIIALMRGHNAVLAIAVTTVLALGLQFLSALFGSATLLLSVPMGIVLWFACFVWSLNSNTRRRDLYLANLSRSAPPPSPSSTSSSAASSAGYSTSSSTASGAGFTS